MGRDASSTDILVIGAGATGAAVAWRLAESGFRVVCLEQGRWQQRSQHPASREDWEFQALANWAPNPNVRNRPEDYPVNDAESPISPLMFNAVGGSTIQWTASCARLHPSDFRVRTLDGAADDWPLSYEELEPFYDLNDEMMGCSGVSGDPANPPRAPRQTPPLGLGRDGLRIAETFDRLGWHWWPSDSYTNSVPCGDDRGGRVCCGPGKPGGASTARASADATYWPKALALGAVLRPRCRVKEITVDDDGRVNGATYYNRNGRLQRLEARAVVLAANAIGTPRLLLLSKSAAHPHGLANSSGLVGKNLMFHPRAMVTGVFDEMLEAWKGPQGSILTSQQFYETNPRRDFIRGFTFQLLRGLGPVWTATGGFHEAVPWGATHHEEFEKRFGRMLTLAVIAEDLPEERNRVTLDPRIADSHGIPAPRITYRVSSNTRNMLDYGAAMARRLLEAAGAHAVMINPLLRNGGWGPIGTARMGEDPARAVVNRWGQAHDCDNLFIVDGSVFVTGGAVDPTATAQALALRTAMYIAGNREDLKAAPRRRGQSDDPAPPKASAAATAAPLAAVGATAADDQRGAPETETTGAAATSEDAAGQPATRNDPAGGATDPDRDGGAAAAFPAGESENEQRRPSNPETPDDRPPANE